jgi:hypothetical protein
MHVLWPTLYLDLHCLLAYQGIMPESLAKKWSKLLLLPPPKALDAEACEAKEGVLTPGRLRGASTNPGCLLSFCSSKLLNGKL